ASRSAGRSRQQRARSAATARRAQRRGGAGGRERECAWFLVSCWSGMRGEGRNGNVGGRPYGCGSRAQYAPGLSRLCIQNVQRREFFLLPATVFLSTETRLASACDVVTKNTLATLLAPWTPRCSRSCKA